MFQTKKPKVEKRLKNYGSVAVSGTLRIMSVNVYRAQHTRHVCLDGFVLWLAGCRLRKPAAREEACLLLPALLPPCFALPSLCLLLSQLSLGTAGFSQTVTYPGWWIRFSQVSFYPCLSLLADM